MQLATNMNQKKYLKFFKDKSLLVPDGGGGGGTASSGAKAVLVEKYDRDRAVV